MASAKTDHALERMVFFSDAVFAIAITLLVVELHPPEFPKGTGDVVQINALLNMIPNFMGFAISFAVVGMFWMGHHRAFSLAARYNGRVLGWNMALLGVVAFMPFTTAYLSVNHFQRVPTILYCAVMLLAGALNLKVNWTATIPPIVDPAASAEQITYIRVRGIAVLLGSATALAIAFFAPLYGVYGLATIGLWRRPLQALASRRREG